jgi:cortactin
MPCLFTTNQSAVGSDYQADLAKHASQTDAAKGFGGKYGVQADRKDKVSIIRIVYDLWLT